MIERDQGAGARGQRRRAHAAELQRRRGPGGRLGVIGPGGVRARRAPRGAAGRGPRGGQARFEAAVDARVEWRGFHAHGFTLAREEPLFDVLGRAHAAVHGAPLEFLAFTGTTDARAFVVHDATAGDVLRPDRRQPARARRVGGSGERQGHDARAGPGRGGVVRRLIIVCVALLFAACGGQTDTGIGLALDDFPSGWTQYGGERQGLPTCKSVRRRPQGRLRL